MHVRCIAFARVRELVGSGSQVLDLAEGATIADAWNHLEARFPTLRDLSASTQIACNGRVVRDRSQRLTESDELALLPPVGGG